MSVNDFISFSIDRPMLERCFVQLDTMTEEKRIQVREAVAESILIIESGAKRNAPVAGKGKFGGFLRARIFSQLKADGFGGRVWDAVPYAPYQEFGTGLMVDVPAGWENFAIQFKGKGIRQVNIRATHFLLYAWEMEMQNFQRKIKTIFGIIS